ncbi:response regulator [Deinococcus radiomollis]|uniref:response regulator n=1 Tax=Deinococcus radiomollis TaxID=468916 RepID=UPI003891473D
MAVVFVAKAMIDLLLIEPDVGTRKTLERLLETSGYSVHGVARGTDALRQIGRQRPDLVISEVTLPDSGGLELCLQLQLSGLPVLLMSSGVDERLRLESQGAGALELLSKPLSELLLLGRLAHHLKLPVPAPPRVTAPSTLLSSLMTRPGMLGAVQVVPDHRVTPETGMLETEGYTVREALGQPIPPALYRAFLNPLTEGYQAAVPTDPALLFSASDTDHPSNRSAHAMPAQHKVNRDRAAGTAELQCIQLDYLKHCLLLFRLPTEAPTLLVCLIQNSSYASLVKYYLRASEHVRL